MYTFTNGVVPSKPIVTCEDSTLVPSLIATNISAPVKSVVLNSKMVCAEDPFDVNCFVNACWFVLKQMLPLM